MLPAYYVSPNALLEIAFAVAELDEGVGSEEISSFTGLKNRTVKESIKVGAELGLFIQNGQINPVELEPSYERDLTMFSPDDRHLILYDALLHYQPFMQFISYLNTGYDPKDAARRVNTVHQISNKPDYVEDYFLRYGEFAGILESNDGVTVTIKSGGLPGDPPESIERLRVGLESEAEVRLYLTELLGDDVAGTLPEDVMDQLSGTFLSYSSDPRDSVTEAGRAIEDYLRWMGNQHGSAGRDYSGASGITPLANHLKGDSLITETHKKKANSIASRRNKAAHGRSSGTMVRWTITEDGALSTALDTAILVRSISRKIDTGDHIL